MDELQKDGLGELRGFVRTAKDAAVPDAALVALLKQNGWSERVVYRALSAYYGERLGVVPPARGGGGVSARDAFYYLLNFITLGFWTTALGSIFYVLIARMFPDPVNYYEHGALINEVSWQLATVLVAFPVFALLHRVIRRELAARPEAADSGVRAWLTYVALVIAACVALGDGIAFLSDFLRGALTMRYVLDTLVVLVLSGGVFAYYLTDLRTRPAR
ncbi:MAG: hypothetical protein JO225_11915 [Candidatus Eremiobacteraeota bacterium]|nr:hypothetical protein [Candidatus Eremiobacteraeota bacterium]MBV8644599.1 hypothetical protein [Candidatus Eremiobacteraeota bacterium]